MAGADPTGTASAVFAPSPTDMLVVEGLTTEIRRRRGSFAAVDGVSFAVRRGEIMGLVGESGCGKTMTVLSLLRLLPAAAEIKAGRALLEGRDLVALSEREMRGVRGKDIAMVFQEPMTSLDPSFTIGCQIDRDDPRARSGDEEGGQRPGDRDARARRDPAARRRVSATIRTSSPAACASA